IGADTHSCGRAPEPGLDSNGERLGLRAFSQCQLRGTLSTPSAAHSNSLRRGLLALSAGSGLPLRGPFAGILTGSGSSPYAMQYSCTRRPNEGSEGSSEPALFVQQPEFHQCTNQH